MLSMQGGVWQEVKLVSLNLFGKTEKAMKSTKVADQIVNECGGVMSGPAAEVAG